MHSFVCRSRNSIFKLITILLLIVLVEVINADVSCDYAMKSKVYTCTMRSTNLTEDQIQIIGEQNPG